MILNSHKNSLKIQPWPGKNECLKNHPTKKALRELASCLTLKSRSFGAQKKGSPHIPGSSSSAILGAMDSVDPADAQPAAGVEDELSRLGRCGFKWVKRVMGVGERAEVSEVSGAQNNSTFESKKEFVYNWTFSVYHPPPPNTIKDYQTPAGLVHQKHFTPHAFYTTKYCREKSDLSFSFLDFSDLSLSDLYFFFCQTLFSSLFYL